MNVNLLHNNSNLSTNKYLKEKYIKIIYNFYQTLSKRIPLELLNNFEHNISTLRIRETKWLNSNVNAFYDTRKNMIVLNKNDNDLYNSLYHELFHLSSTKILKGQIYSGLSQIISSFTNDFSIFEGINEGYTEILKQRYFQGKITYNIETIYAFLLETFIGKNKMEQLYFNNNFYGLIGELKKYLSTEEIIEFINDADFISQNIRKLSNNYIECQERLIKSMKFLIKCQLKNLKKSLIYCNSNNKNFKDVLNHSKELHKFILNKTYNINNHKYYLIDRRTIYELIDEIFDNSDTKTLLKTYK